MVASTYRVPEGTDIVINATSIGLFPDVDARLDLDLDSLSAGHGRGGHHPQSAAHHGWSSTRSSAAAR